MERCVFYCFLIIYNPRLRCCGVSLAGSFRIFLSFVSRMVKCEPSKVTLKSSFDVSRSKAEAWLVGWYDAKQRAAELDKQINGYKKKIESMMMSKGVTVLTGTTLMAEWQKQSRLSVSPKDLPENIFSEYAKQTTFNVLYLKKAEAAKVKRKDAGVKG